MTTSPLGLEANDHETLREKVYNRTMNRQYFDPEWHSVVRFLSLVMGILYAA